MMGAGSSLRFGLVGRLELGEPDGVEAGEGDRPRSPGFERASNGADEVIRLEPREEGIIGREVDG